MGMYTEPILKLIVQQPGLRAVEIADTVDCEIDLVQPAIRNEIDSGIVIVKQEKAPNGLVLPTFYPTADLRTIYSPSKPSPDQLPENLQKTKLDQALDYIRANGRVTSADLKAFFKTRAHPSAYLSPALKDGRVVRDGEDWMISGQPPAVSDAEPDKKSGVTGKMSHPVEIPEFLAKEVDPAPVEQSQPAAAAQPAAANPGFIKIQLSMEPTYTIKAGAVTIPGLRVVDEWKEFSELQNAQGYSLIVLRGCVIDGHPELMRLLSTHQGATA